jgi:hypothetical protein
VFTSLTLRGGAGTLLWGYRPAVELKAWTISKHEGQWTLRATIARIDRFQARQTPLLFTAPRPGGFWAWAVEAIDLGDHALTAKLGPPEQ